MGQEEAQSESSENKLEKISRNFFDFQYVIGKGGFGKVINYKIYNLYIYKKGLESQL